MNDIFPVGRPVGADDIVGREGFISQCVLRLHDGQSVMIASPRRTGKSSVAGEVLRRLTADGHPRATVDLFYVSQLEELAAKLLAAVIETRTGPFRRAVHSLAGLRETLNRVQWGAKIGDLELAATLDRRQADPFRTPRDRHRYRPRSLVKKAASA